MASTQFAHSNSKSHANRTGPTFRKTRDRTSGQAAEKGCHNGVDLPLRNRYNHYQLSGHSSLHQMNWEAGGGWRFRGEKKDIPGIDMSLWRFTELQFEALPLNNLPDTAVKLMYCKLMDTEGEKLTELTFYADPRLPQGQCWMKNGGGMYYPVSSRLVKDLQGMFPISSAGTDPVAPRQ